jgi:hypothetical protein
MTIHKTAEPVVLEGFQAILKPSEFGYSLKCIITDEALINNLTSERAELLKGVKAKLKNPKRSTEKPEPWEEVAQGRWSLKFSWDEKSKPTVVDAEGTLITSETLPIYSGSKVRLAFIQKGYTLKDGVTYGSSVKLSGIQVISLNSTGTPSLTGEEAANLFGSYEGGFVATELPEDEDEDEDEDEVEDGEEEAEDKEF